jgi:hypothetical protein
MEWSTLMERENRIGLDPEYKMAARTIFFLQKRRKEKEVPCEIVMPRGAKMSLALHEPI